MFRKKKAEIIRNLSEPARPHARLILSNHELFTTWDDLKYSLEDFTQAFRSPLFIVIVFYLSLYFWTYIFQSILFRLISGCSVLSTAIILLYSMSALIITKSYLLLACVSGFLEFRETTAVWWRSSRACCDAWRARLNEQTSSDSLASDRWTASHLRHRKKQ